VVYFKFVPVCDMLLDAMVDYLPLPLDIGAVNGTNLKEELTL
jgi:hypothetical protein